jgi:hypothetical protein
MPDLPTPQDPFEAVLLSECWDAVLSYADLCTTGPDAAAELATEAFALGVRELRSDDTAPAVRRSSRPPALPTLLTAVRTAAAEWERGGKGQLLDPDLRLWLNSQEADRYTGPPLQRPVALRGLRDLQDQDGDLLWLVEVEALPLSVVARRLGLDPAHVSQDVAQVRGLFRDRCHRNHLDSPMAPRCRSYAQLLEAATRSPESETPDDLSRHLATCRQCAETAACLRTDGDGPATALATGVLGWGGLAYVERRRRAAESRLGGARADADTGPPDPHSRRSRLVRGGIFVTAALVSLVALGVSLMPRGGDFADRATGREDGRPVAHPGHVTPSASRTADGGTGAPADRASASPSVSDASPGAGPDERQQGPSDPEPQGDNSAAAEGEDKGGSGSGSPGGSGPASGSGTGGAPAPGTTRAPAACSVRYELVHQWPDGFQATVRVVTDVPLEGWTVSWSFRDGQRISQMWDAEYTQSGSRVTATAASYNRSVAADGALSFGFLASWRGTNSPAHDFRLNGKPCS